jgi:hypothetical protein
MYLLLLLHIGCYLTVMIVTVKYLLELKSYFVSSTYDASVRISVVLKSRDI